MIAQPPPRDDKWLEIASAVVLSIAAMETSWAGYQAALLDGEQAASYSRANALRIQASRHADEAHTLAAIEVAVFNEWLDAKAHREERLATFYQARFPAQLRPAFNDWLRDRPFVNPSAAPTPFQMRSYRPRGREIADELERQADKTFADGQRANQISDAYVQGSTIMATAMFFGGIGQIFRVRPARIGLLVIASIAVLIGLVRVVTLPLQTLGFAPLA